MTLTQSQSSNLVAVLRDKNHKRMTQSLEADSPEELRNKVEGRIHDLFVHCIVLSAIYGLICTVATVLAIGLVGVTSVWWFPVTVITVVGGYAFFHPQVRQSLAWREEWTRICKENHWDKPKKKK